MHIQDSQIIITVVNNQTTIERFSRVDDKSPWEPIVSLNSKQSLGQEKNNKIEERFDPDFGQLRRIMNIAFRNELRQSKGE